ncbi:hypothetical protein [Rosenbergiella nectarea]|uniref:hypothetical protein n=1 Tax=Rosenbergiella nectarea TaxID=988801 RepID=UPI001BD9C2CD|nr:hypothetical protein [Rosenbergiella nectarea]MBT0730875.1 hypothetical protein [Rosenbergiella nectarea subsp. apis]
MTKTKMTLYCLSLLLLITKNQALAKDPFQPIDSSQCTALATQLDGWELNAVLISPSQCQALMSHRVLGIRKVELASQPSFIHGRVTRIELTHIEISALPPCPANRITLSFKGVS